MTDYYQDDTGVIEAFEIAYNQTLQHCGARRSFAKAHRRRAMKLETNYHDDPA